MLSNSLIRDIGLKVGPVMLGTFVKHYFDRVKASETDPDKLLKQDEILYDEAFNIIKSFLHESTFHTVEELQGFSNTQTLSSPWTHVVRVLIPLSSCDEAARYLVKCLGGEDRAREVVGGVKWWQVRGIEGVDAQWITAKKDWREAKKRYKMHQNQMSNLKPGNPQLSQQLAQSPNGNMSGTYEKHMDEMRCILYIHGGGYYFGSVDQERYSIQRHARKINGRVFAINYRLAPQYPFPCGLQDCLAAYIYLIRPPPEADHSPINPANIVIAGDSAGGGMSLALLQVIRDAELPMPAGGVLVSPWCDLTHSFPSVHTNTDTDIIPPTGLSLHKPSVLWPPPSLDVSTRVHASLRQKLRQAFKMDEDPAHDDVPEQAARSSRESHSVLAPDMPVNVGDNIPVPSINASDPRKIALVTEKGEKLEIDQQVHLYAQNSLLVHPLVSPALGYLGGLPPLLFIAGDKEVLRDEVIYTAHKAARPLGYAIKDQTKKLYAPLRGIEERHPQPTSVHLQVYDGTCHVLPVLFLFSTPAKYCYRAMASFIKFVTGASLTPTSPSMPKIDRAASSPDIKRVASPEPLDDFNPPPVSERQASSASASVDGYNSGSSSPHDAPSVPRKQSLRRTLSSRVAKASRALRRRSHSPIHEGEAGNIAKENSTTSSDVAGARFHSTIEVVEPQERHAGEPSVYGGIEDRKAFEMIQERVSTQGVIRPLEAKSELDAFKVPEELVGTISELAIKRYLNGDAQFRQKFAHVYKAIEKTRKKYLEREAKHEGKFRASKYNGKDGITTPNGTRPKGRNSVVNHPGWGYAWALDELERPPPSSIVARRDTEEARKLAEIADRALVEDTSALNANSLWSVMMNFLTVTPDRKDSGTGQGESKEGLLGVDEEGKGISGEATVMARKGKVRHRISQFFFMGDHHRKEDKPPSP